MDLRCVISTVDDGKRIARKSMPDGITIHRTGVDRRTGIVLGSDAVSICAHFTGKDQSYPDVKKATGGHNPYTFIIGAAGEIWQCLPVSDVGHHARVWSTSTIGIAAIGDFRYDDPDPKQPDATAELCAVLCHLYAIDPRDTDHRGIPKLAAHDERPEGSRDINKRCPGARWDMKKFRQEVDDLVRELRTIEASQLGVVL